MAAESTLEIVQEGRWRSGLINFLRKENGIWWRTRKWCVSSIVWFLISNGLVVLLLWIVPAADPAGAPPPREVFNIFSQTFAISMIGVAILMQGVIVNEKQSGTAAWVLTNPISRTAFILAKFIAHAFAILTILVVLQGSLGYLQFWLKGSSFLQPIPFMTAMGLYGLQVVFYITLSLFLGTAFSSRGPVVGITLAVFFFQDLAIQLAKEFMPWLVPFLPGSLTPMAVIVLQGGGIASSLPILATTLYTCILLLAAILRFKREEF